MSLPEMGSAAMSARLELNPVTSGRAGVAVATGRRGQGAGSGGVKAVAAACGAHPTRCGRGGAGVGLREAIPGRVRVRAGRPSKKVSDLIGGGASAPCFARRLQMSRLLTRYSRFAQVVLDDVVDGS